MLGRKMSKIFNVSTTFNLFPNTIRCLWSEQTLNPKLCDYIQRCKKRVKIKSKQINIFFASLLNNNTNFGFFFFAIINNRLDIEWKKIPNFEQNPVGTQFFFFCTLKSKRLLIILNIQNPSKHTEQLSGFRIYFQLWNKLWNIITSTKCWGEISTFNPANDTNDKNVIKFWIISI